MKHLSSFGFLPVSQSSQNSVDRRARHNKPSSDLPQSSQASEPVLPPPGPSHGDLPQPSQPTLPRPGPNHGDLSQPSQPHSPSVLPQSSELAFFIIVGVASKNFTVL